MKQSFRLCTEKAWGIEGEHCIFVRKAITLNIKQNSMPATTAHFDRTFTIEAVSDFDAMEIEEELGPQEPETVERVREEVERIIEGIAEFRTWWKDLRVEGLNYFKL